MAPSVVALAAALATAAAQSLQPLKWLPLNITAVRPEGWLLRELRIQSDGLQGHMPLFYADINASTWIGGNSKRSGDWVEEFPYVIAGTTPMAILLRDPVQLAIVQKWVDYIVSHQGADGSMGPTQTGETGGMYFWPRWPVIAAFYQWYEYTGDYKTIDASLKWLHLADTQLGLPAYRITSDWTGVRLQVRAISVVKHIIKKGHACRIA